MLKRPLKGCRKAVAARMVGRLWRKARQPLWAQTVLGELGRCKKGSINAQMNIEMVGALEKSVSGVLKEVLWYDELVDVFWFGNFFLKLARDANPFLACSTWTCSLR